MKSKNTHIEEYLDYYLSLDDGPQFAVLIEGEWGAGKTWFIKNYFGERPQVPHLFVSLNGVSSFKEIEESFFQQLHPVLSSKGMKIAGKIVKGLIKTTINIDLDNDKKSDVNISASVPDIDLPAYLKNIEEKVLVFDDLERCSIAIPAMLGYINQFVEHNGSKAIVLCNEDEIIKRESGNHEAGDRYLLIKEKVIGRSFKIVSSLEEALDLFIGAVKGSKVKSHLNKHKEILKHVFEVGRYNNLRHLRLTILDFERFFSFLPIVQKDKQSLSEHIVNLFFAISFELRKGKLVAEDIPMLFPFHFIDKAEDTGDDENAERSSVLAIREKYPVFNYSSSPINAELLEEYFRSGKVDKTLVKQSIRNSVYYKSENTPDWIKLWHYYDLDDDEFAHIFGNCYSKLQKSGVEEKFELMHLIGMFLLFVSHGYIEGDKDEIVEFGRRNLAQLAKDGRLVISRSEEFPSNSSQTLGYHGMDIPEFKEFLKFATDLAEHHRVSNLPDKAKDILSEMSKSPKDFSSSLLINHDRESFFDTPILIHVTASEFLEAFCGIKNKEKKIICNMFRNRYQHELFREKLIPELNWLKELSKCLSKEIEGRKKTISRIWLDQLDNSLNTAIDLLERQSSG